MFSWETCRDAFKPDGTLRDIYVLNTTLEDWRAVFAMLRADYALEYFVDGKPCAPFPTADEALAVRNTANPMLQFRVSGVLVVCHFFGSDEIEFDINPLDVTSAPAFDALLSFLRRLGDLVRKPVILCFENDQQHPLISYDPAVQEVRFHSYEHLDYSALRDKLFEGETVETLLASSQSKET